MVRNIKMSLATRRWIRRHNRRHGTPERQAVIVRKHTRTMPLGDTETPITVGIVQGTAHCACGDSRPAYVSVVYGVDPASVPA